MGLINKVAHQRTFEGAYWRTALSAFSMGLLILKVFTIEFYRIALVFFAFGTMMVLIAHMRTRNSIDVYNQQVPFKTNGNIVFLSFVTTLSTFMILFILIYRMDL